MTAYKNLGNSSLYESDFTSALNYYSEAINIGTELGDDKATADLYTNTGIIHHFQGHFTVALKFHLNAFKTYERLGEPERMATSYTNIGLIYFEQKNYADALKTYEKALAIRTEKKDEEALGDLHNNIGNVYKELTEYNRALKHHAIALNIRTKLNNPQGKAYSFNNLGTIYFGMGDLKTAWEYYERSLDIWHQVEDKRGITECYVNLGELFIRNCDYVKAGQYLQNARKLALETGAKNALRDIFLHLSELGAVQKDFEKAYRYYKEYSSVDKEITSADISRQLTQLTLGYEIEQKERETEIERVKNAELNKAYVSLDEEKQKSESLLLNILPGEVAAELKIKGFAEPRHYDCVTILFADIKNFTKISEALSAAQLISSLDVCFREFDRIVEKHGVEKIKVIGDAYMCAGGLPVANSTHAFDVIEAALEMQVFLNAFEAEQLKKNLPLFQFRMGVHSGPVVAGIVGLKKFAYDIWGDTVNMAARMESAGEAGQVNISGFTYHLVKHHFNCTHRGKIEAKNKGLVDMYFVEPKGLRPKK
jgi:class 3 adenylate cyclase